MSLNVHMAKRMQTMSDDKNGCLVDAHLHIQDFGNDFNIDDMLAQSKETEICYFVCNSTSEADWDKVINLSDEYPQVIPFLGIHPWFVNERSINWAEILEKYIMSYNCGIGECGLDRLHGSTDAQNQEEILRIHIRLAAKYGRPISIHCVRYWGLLINILKSEKNLPKSIMIHSYGGSEDFVRQLSEFDIYFSFSGKVLSPQYEKARKALAVIPINRLLIETDSPNMLPTEDYQCYHININGSQYNHPGNLSRIVNGIAEILNIEPHILKEYLWNNSKRYLSPIFKI